jgi:TolB-like protein
MFEPAVGGDDGSSPAVREFLEGLDIPGEEGFEDWLRAQRRFLEQPPPPAAAPPPQLPSHIVDVSRPAPGFGGQPALAVLPFQNLTGDSENDYLAEGLGEELIWRLTQLRWLPVIARSSSFAYEGKDIDHVAIGRQLGAKYLFEGRLRRVDEGRGFQSDGGTVEAASGRVLWADRLEQPLIRSRRVQTEIVARLVGALDTRIDAAEQLPEPLTEPHDPEPDLSVRDLIWRGRWHLNRFTKANAERARVLFDRALELEPDSPEALIQAAFALARSIWAERRPQEEGIRLRAMARGRSAPIRKTAAPTCWRARPRCSFASRRGPRPCC